MNHYRFVLYCNAYGKVLRTRRNPNAPELYWRGLPGSDIRKITTNSLSKAAQFITADDARAAVNEMVNSEQAPQTLLDMRIGKRMIVEE